MQEASRRLRTQPGAVSPPVCADGFIARSGTYAGFLSGPPLVDSPDDEEPLAGLDEAEPPGTPGESLRRVGLGDLAGELVAFGAERPDLGSALLERRLRVEIALERPVVEEPHDEDRRDCEPAHERRPATDRAARSLARGPGRHGLRPFVGAHAAPASKGLRVRELDHVRAAGKVYRRPSGQHDEIALVDQAGLSAHVKRGRPE